MKITDIPGYREAPRIKHPHHQGEKHGRGRPFQVATVPLAPGRNAILDSFHKVMKSLTYREVTALARRLNRHPSTVTKWRYQLQFPHPFIMLDIIEWRRLGKPTETGHHRETGITVGKAKAPPSLT